MFPIYAVSVERELEEDALRGLVLGDLLSLLMQKDVRGLQRGAPPPS